MYKEFIQPLHPYLYHPQELIECWALESLVQKGLNEKLKYQQPQQQGSDVNIFCISFDDQGTNLALSTEEKDIQIWDFTNKELK